MFNIEQVVKEIKKGYKNLSDDKLTKYFSKFKSKMDPIIQKGDIYEYISAINKMITELENIPNFEEEFAEDNVETNKTEETVVSQDKDSLEENTLKVGSVHTDNEYILYVPNVKHVQVKIDKGFVYISAPSFKSVMLELPTDVQYINNIKTDNVCIISFRVNKNNPIII